MGKRPYHDPDKLKKLYWDKEMSLNEIGKKYNCSHNTIHYWMKKHNIDREKHSCKKPPMFRLKDGYEVWRTEVKGTNHSVRVHRLLAVAEYGFEEVSEKVIHHKNKIPFDNREDNIIPVTREEHTEIHN